MQKSLCLRYHQLVQAMASVIQPIVPKRDRRHYENSAGGSDPADCRLMEYLQPPLEAGTQAPYELQDAMSSQERTGVYHLVQGWHQQSQLNKGLFLSGDMVQTSRGLSAIQWHYRASQPIAEIIATMFRVLLPDVYKMYKAAFDAGVWEEADPGPWIGRAIVYKLQVFVHRDGRDDGPTASFPVGDFDGGEMNMPDLGAKFQ